MPNDVACRMSIRLSPVISQFPMLIIILLRGLSQPKGWVSPRMRIYDGCCMMSVFRI